MAVCRLWIGCSSGKSRGKRDDRLNNPENWQPFGVPKVGDQIAAVMGTVIGRSPLACRPSQAYFGILRRQRLMEAEM